MSAKDVNYRCTENRNCRTNKDEAKWFFIPLALGAFSALLGCLGGLYFLGSAEREKPLVQCRVFDVSVRHAANLTFDVGDFFVSSHETISNG